MSMISQLGKSFDSLRIFSPFFVKARLILQKLAIDKRDWDNEVTESVVKEWKVGFNVLDYVLDISLARHYFAGSTPASFTPGLDPYAPVGRAHDKDELRRDYRFNLALADGFWYDWMDFYQPIYRVEISGWKLLEPSTLGSWF